MKKEWDGKKVESKREEDAKKALPLTFTVTVTATATATTTVTITLIVRTMPECEN